MSTAIQFLRYLVVGGAAAAVDTATLYGLHSFLGARLWVAAAAGFTLGMLVNYLVSAAWVFESRGRMREELPLFALIGLGGLAWTEIILWVAIELSGVPVMAAKAVALGLVLIWNFGMRKRYVFSGPGKPGA